MTTQLNPVIYGKAIQYQLNSIVTPVPVYAAFNRNFATQPKFITWQLRDVHQPVFTGSQTNKGIDSPVFQISIFTQVIEDGFALSNQILQALHGYIGIFGNPNTDGFFIGKADVMWLYNGYDDENKLGTVFLDCTLFIPA